MTMMSNKRFPPCGNSPKSVLTGTTFLDESSANRRREYSVFGVRLRKVSCRWSGHRDRAERREGALHLEFIVIH